MDTEFPGVVAKPVGTFKTTHEFYFQTLRCNVNLLKIIQLGISLMNERGEVPDKCCTWQFNFQFSLQEDIYAQDSIDLLKASGINFEHFAKHGIDMQHFAELMIGSGLVLCPDVHWLSFHSGYDFGYLVKILSGKELHDKEEEFMLLFHLLFPSVYDVKYILRQTDLQHTLGLDALGDSLCIRRIGMAHQAGSDSLLTGHVFFKLLRERFNNTLPVAACGILYGLGEDSASNTTPATPLQGQPQTSPFSGIQTSSSQFPSQPGSTAMNLVMHGSNASKIHTNATYK
jgi:CCR4-NOT transcription complex subunit 7/8